MWGSLLRMSKSFFISLKILGLSGLWVLIKGIFVFSLLLGGSASNSFLSKFLALRNPDWIRGVGKFCLWRKVSSSLSLVSNVSSLEIIVLSLLAREKEILISHV